MVEMKTFPCKEEWLKNRTWIGGSDASAIVGLNPYKTNVQLWEEKVGMAVPKDISDKPYVKYGTQAEMHLRGLFRLDFPQYKLDYVDNNMFLNDKYPWAHASLDGWLERTIIASNGVEVVQHGILEIKTTEILQSMQKEKWNHRIPDNYYIQILHYLMVTEFDFAVLKAQLKTVFDGVPYLQTKHYLIERADVEEDIQYLAECEKEFWKQVQERKRPDLLLPEI
jgi:putative phage-type endonuclease